MPSWAWVDIVVVVVWSFTFRSLVYYPGNGKYLVLKRAILAGHQR